MSEAMSMLGILSLILFFLLVMLLAYFKLEILQPAVLMVGTMFMSVFLAFLNVEKWELQFGIFGFVAILVAMFSFSFGAIWSRSFCFDGITRELNFDINRNFKINYFIFFILMILMVVMAWFSLSEMEKLALRLGNQEGYNGIIKTIRPAIERHQVELSRWMNYRHILAQVITYIYLYVFVRTAMLQSFCCKAIVFLLPLVLYMPFIVLTTGRMALICLVIYIIAIIGILYEQKYKGLLKSRFILTGGALLGGVGFITAFFLFGMFSGKIISADRTPFVILSHYAGCSIPALDYLLNQVPIESANVGETTLVGIYRILNRVGMNLPEVQIFLPFVYFSGIDTNVYTAEGRYIKDFGYTGMMGIMFFEGVIYTYLYESAKRKNSFILHIFYGSICYPLFLSSIDDRLFTDLVGTAILYLFVLIWGLSGVVFAKDSKRLLKLKLGIF